MRYVAVGVVTDGRKHISVTSLFHPARMRVLGPYETADDAREAVNAAGMADFVWNVRPLVS